jgi:Tol biopolymer transport system component
MATDGSQVRQLTHDGTKDCFWGRISPSRTRILFTCAPAGVHDTDYTKASIWVVNVDGTGAQEIRAVGADGWSLQGHEEWAPDGGSVALTGGLGPVAELFRVAVDGQNPMQITHWGTTTTDVSWAPNGSSLVTNSCATQGFVGCPRTALEIFTLALDGTNPRRLTNDSLPDYDPYYSLDGMQIAWLVNSGGPTKWGIYIMAGDGSNQRAVIDDGSINSKPAWSLAGDRIYFHRMAPSTAGKWHVFSIHPDGAGLVDLTANETSNSEYPGN